MGAAHLAMRGRARTSPWQGAHQEATNIRIVLGGTAGTGTGALAPVKAANSPTASAPRGKGGA